MTEFSLPVSAQSLCALRTSAQGSRCLDVDFWREKIRGKILRSETSNSAIYLLWRELTRTDLLRRHLLAKHWTKQNSKSKDDTKKLVFWLKLKWIFIFDFIKFLLTNINFLYMWILQNKIFSCRLWFKGQIFLVNSKQPNFCSKTPTLFHKFTNLLV